MTGGWRIIWILLAWTGLAVPAACSRADLQVITGVPTSDGGTGGSGGAGSGGMNATGGATGTGGGGRGVVDGGSGMDAEGGAGAAGGAGGMAGAGGTAGAGGKGGSGPRTCPTPALASGDRMVTVQVGTASRSYFLHVPQAYTGTTAVPLILDFHLLNSTGRAERLMSPYPAEVDPDGVIMAFPNGLPGPAGAAWDIGPCCVANADDVAFSRAVVEDVGKSACIDPRRVYAVGMSMGGGMAHYLGCEAADVFAGVAPSAFDLLEENVPDCKPAFPITVISFRGTADTVVPYAGGYSATIPGMPVNFLGAKGTFQKWAELDGCQGTPSAEDVATGCSTYANCKDGVEVVLCTKQGGNQAQGNASVSWPLLKSHLR